MIVKKCRRKIELSNNIVVDNVKIEKVLHTKFLGVLIDQHLTFEAHVKNIKGKISRGIGILFKARKYLNKTSLLTLYHAFINLYFMYCVTIWGNTYQSVLDPLYKLQKRTVRLVMGAGKYDHTYPIFQNLKILNLRNVYL